VRRASIAHAMLAPVASEVSFTIRPAAVADAGDIAAIFNQGIEERETTFETRPRTEADLAGPIADPDAPPFLVAERDGVVVGWGRITAYSARSCYAGVGEASIYVDRNARGGGVGRLLLRGLSEAAEVAGYWKLLGLLFPSNAASAALFRAAGFREVGVYRRHGRLEGEWRDVLLVERLLGPAAL
jgi:L-amino acid N-acyltransferase YncA